MYSKLALVIICCFLFLNEINAQSLNDYRTRQTGNWNDLNSWEFYNGSAWTSPASLPNNSANTITVRNPHSVNLSGKVTVDQVTIEPGASVVINSSDTLSVANGSGTDLTVNGTLVNSGIITVSSGGGVSFTDGSRYVHSRNGGAIPTASWSSNSSCEITSVTSDAPSSTGLNQQFGNFTWNCPQQSVHIDLNLYRFSTAGNLRFTSTGGKWLYLIDDKDTLKVSGNLILEGGWVSLAVGSEKAIVTLAGDFIMTAGQLDNQTTSDYYAANFFFNKSGTQNYTKTGGVITGRNINWSVYTGSRLNLCSDFVVENNSTARILSVYGTLCLGRYLVTGTGIFDSRTGSTLEIGSPDGIRVGTVLSGNIQVTGGRIFVTAVKYIFNSDVPQSTGDPFGIIQGIGYARGFVVDNQGGYPLTISNNITIMDSLVIRKGSINTNNFKISYATNTAKLFYRGNVTQTTSDAELSATSNPAEIVIDNPGGVILHASRSVKGTVTTVHGGLNLNGNNLTLDDTGLLNESAGNTIGGSSGTLTAYVTNLSSPVQANPGNLGAIISAQASLGRTYVTRGHSAFTAAGLYGINRYYNISPTNNSLLNATLTLKYDHSELNGIPEDNLILFKSTNSGVTWTAVASTLDKVNNKITASGISSFSLWTIGDVNPPLPVCLTDFRAEENKNFITLKWNTATETGNYGFEIERRSSFQPLWKKVGFTKGYGNSNSPKEYVFFDKDLHAPAEYFYRLKQIDCDGEFKYSEEVKADFNYLAIGCLRQNYPNPFNPVTNIEFSIPEKCNVKLTLYNVLGNRLAELVNEFKNEGSYNVSFDASGYASGIYIYRLQAGKYTEVKKMHLIK